MAKDLIVDSENTPEQARARVDAAKLEALSINKELNDLMLTVPMPRQAVKHTAHRLAQACAWLKLYAYDVGRDAGKDAERVAERARMLANRF
jgi:hypothetical protein